jgi:ribosomal protein S18 acetylase RimI-like enzyme
MNVTTARLEDLTDLLELVADYQSLDDTAEPIDDSVNEQFLKEILDNTSQSALLTGRTSSGELIGFVMIHCTPSAMRGRRAAQITDLFVHPEYREQGFGRQLFQHAIRWAKERKQSHVIWYVENMNMTAQYMFDRIENVSQSGWLGYSLPLSAVER